jgi:hypothetical protein
MKTLNILLLVAIMACIPLVMLFAAPTKPLEKPLRDLSLEELLNRLETGGPNQTEAFDMFINRLGPFCTRADHICITYRGYGFQEGLSLNFAPPAREDLVVVPLGPAIMSQLDLKGGVIVYNVKGDMKSVSGLHEDDIVYSVNGTEITHVASFNKALSSCEPDKMCTFTILRGGKSQDLKFSFPPPPAH